MESLAESIVLFYYFAYLDERKSVEAATVTFRRLQRYIIKQKKKGRILSQMEINALIVAYTNESWNYWRFKFHRTVMTSGGAAGPNIKLFEKVQLGPWREFQKSARNDRKFLFVIWSHILNFSDREISDGLEINEGTVRFRVGRGLRKLGDFVFINPRKVLGLIN